MGFVLDTAFWLIVAVSVWALLERSQYERVNLVFVAPVWCVLVALLHAFLRDLSIPYAFLHGLQAYAAAVAAVYWLRAFMEYRAAQSGRASIKQG